MSKVITATLEHATALNIDIGGTTMMAFDSDGVSRPNGKDEQWYQDLVGSAFTLGGAGSLAEAVLPIGSFRQYNAFEFINHASNDPFLEFSFIFPPDYDAAAVKFTCNFVRLLTATGTDIVTTVRAACIGVADSLDATLSTGVPVTDTTGANDALFAVEHTITPANAADGGLCHGFIQRNASDVADDYTGSVYLINARVEYS